MSKHPSHEQGRTYLRVEIDEGLGLNYQRSGTNLHLTCILISVWHGNYPAINPVEIVNMYTTDIH